MRVDSRLLTQRSSEPEIAFHPRPRIPLRSRLPDRLRDLIRGEIESGRWQRELPSERRLADEFQVGRPSIHTALRALEREGLLRSRSNRPWEIVSRAMPTTSKRKRRDVVVLLRNPRTLPNLMPLLSLVDSLRQKLHKIGLDLVIADTLTHGVRSVGKELSEIESGYAASFYLLASLPHEAQHWFQEQGLPALILGSRWSDIRLPAVDDHPVATMGHAVEYLCRRGHRRILLLSPEMGGIGSSLACERFVERCEGHRKIGVNGRVLTPSPTPAAIKTAIQQRFGAIDRETAVIAMGMETVICLYATLAEMNLKVPEDVSIVSTSYWPILDFLSPLPVCYMRPWDQTASFVHRVISDYLRLGVISDRFKNFIARFRDGKSVSALF